MKQQYVDNTNTCIEIDNKDVLDFKVVVERMRNFEAVETETNQEIDDLERDQPETETVLKIKKY